MARHLVSGFIQNPLKAGTGFLQATLRRARAHVEHLRDCIDGGALSGQSVLNGSVHEFDETVLSLILS
jgi:hypothetical protein